MHSYYFFKLYNKQKVVAENLKKAINEKGFDSEFVCQKAKIKPDDLEKILAGSFNKYEAYTETMFVLMYMLDVSAEELIGEEKPNDIRHIREWEGLDLDTVAKKTGLSPERLEEIENGKLSSLSELRSIAYALRVGITELVGENMFPVQVYAKHEKASENQFWEDISGFCGYVGILLKGERDYLWYPVAYKALSDIQNGLITGGIQCIPTFNNKLLMLNMDSVSGIVCSRGPAGSPVITDWNVSDPELGLELVVYEAMPEYIACSGNGDMDRFEGTELLKAVLGSAKDKYILSGCCNKVVIRYRQAVKTFTADITKNSSLPSDLNGFVLYKNMNEKFNKYHFNTMDGNLVFGRYCDVDMIELPLAMAVNGMIEDRNREFEKQCKEMGEKRIRS